MFTILNLMAISTGRLVNASDRLVEHQGRLVFKANYFIANIDTTKTSAGSTLNNQFRIPTYSTGSYAFQIYWGDGTEDEILSWDQAEITHTYAEAGVYQIIIYGEFNGWRFVNTGDRLKLITILRWGDLEMGSLDQNFYGCTNLDIQAIDTPILSGKSDYSFCFRGCTS
ncbi:MAG: hypothetical protein GX154_02320, partial [Clostridiales bacterium]|nr:hypothetical protein [Clostridiales bacterium]